MPRTIKYLDYVIYWSIVLLPFSIAIAPAVANTFMGFMFASFLVKKILKRQKLFISTPLNLPFLLLILISLVSFRNSIDYHASFRGIIKLIQNAFLFLICAQEIKDRKHILRIVLSIILGASLSSFDAIWQIIFGKDFIRGNSPIINIGLKRATASFPDANVFGVYLGAIAMLVIGLALYYYRGKKKALMLFASALVIAGLALSFSRGTALALYVSILLLSLLKKDRILFIWLLILLAVSVFIAPKNIKEWARSVRYDPVLLMCNADRVSIYRNSINMIRHHPVIGVGVNTFSVNYSKYKLPEEANAITGKSMYAHNHFLQMAGEVGLSGLLVFFWLLFRLFKKTLLTYRKLKDKDSYLGVVSLSILTCFVAFLVNGLTETSLYYARVAMIFWFLIGLSLAFSKFADADGA